MLTRIEIDGFKSFAGLKVDLEPFAVLVGPNASGKSNLFDAIGLLSRLAAGDLRTAFGGLRGEVREAFRATSGGREADRMTFAVEVLVPSSVVDPWGVRAGLRNTRIRYEVAIRRERDAAGIERLYVDWEDASPIRRADDDWRTSSGVGRPLFRYGQRTPWLATDLDNGSFGIRRDGRSGRNLRRPARAAESTMLSSIANTEYPHLYALRRELESWRFLHLDPAALRKPSPTTAPDTLSPDGANLATVLAAIRTMADGPDDCGALFADIAAELCGLIPGVIDFDVTEDAAAREYRIEITTRDKTSFPSRVVSDGTLRVLALLTALYDPRRRGLICFEDLENGVHPGSLRTLITRLRELVATPFGDDDASLSQLLMTSHSPVVLSLLQSERSNGARPGCILWADMVTQNDPERKTSARRTRIRPVSPQAQPRDVEADADRVPVTAYEVKEYLNAAARGG